jgi:Flp pilus assembly protein TadB
MGATEPVAAKHLAEMKSAEKYADTLVALDGLLKGMRFGESGDLERVEKARSKRANERAERARSKRANERVEKARSKRANERAEKARSKRANERVDARDDERANERVGGDDVVFTRTEILPGCEAMATCSSS